LEYHQLNHVVTSTTGWCELMDVNHCAIPPRCETLREGMEVGIHALLSAVGHLDGTVFNLHSPIVLITSKETGVPYCLGLRSPITNLKERSNIGRPALTPSLY